MLRVFLVLLAVLLAAFAFVFGRPWMYVGAGTPLLGVLGLIGWDWWTRYQSHRRHTASPSRTSQHNPSADGAEDLGIVEVRPQENPQGRGPLESEANPSGDEAPAPSGHDAGSSSESASPPNGSGPSIPDTEVAPPVPAAARATPSEPDPAPESASEADADSSRSALVPLLDSARRALGAHTVCVLVQADVALEYQIEAIASKSPSVRTDGSFETRTPLLGAAASRQSVSVRSLDEQDRHDLRYYEEPPAVLGQVAVAPVPRPDESSTIFLLADAIGGVDLNASRARTLLEHYAKTVHLLLEPTKDEPTDESSLEGTPAASPSTAPPHDAREPSGDGSSPRPRREIIAEEMEETGATDEPLALALVHLNRAESIARRGDEAVASAERRLQARLEQQAPGPRIERFGELTYGLFVRKRADEVEDWAAALQRAMARETGALEGGVSVGVAVRTPSHTDPVRLRTDATEALREAYETGTCTIVA